VPEYRKEVAVIHRSKGDLMQRKEQLTKAKMEFRSALFILDKLVEDFPLVPDYRRMQGLLNSQLALLHYETQRKPESKLRAALPILARLIGDFPALPGYRQRQESVRSQLSALFLVELRRSFGQALAIQEKLITQYPEVTEYHADLAITHFNLGYILLQQNIVWAGKQALPHFKESIVQDSFARKGNPQNTAIHDRMVKEYKFLLGLLLGLQMHAEAAKTAAELVQTFPGDYHELLRAAQCLALCVDKAKADKTLSEQQRLGLAEDYGNQAVNYLRNAVLKGLNDAKEVNAPEYNSLRERADFKKIIEEIKKTRSTDIG
jgi:hypothetical protein